MNHQPSILIVPLVEAGIKADPNNARLHTPRNIGVIEDSMQTDGAGRSILVDRNGVTIAGAGAWEAATQAGIKLAAVIETDGDTLVVVKRPVTPGQRQRLALADNRATELSTWDTTRLHALREQAPEILKDLWTERELASHFVVVVSERRNHTNPARRIAVRMAAAVVFKTAASDLSGQAVQKLVKSSRGRTLTRVTPGSPSIASFRISGCDGAPTMSVLRIRVVIIQEGR